MLRAIREALLTGASAPQVAQALSERADFPRDTIPSERTISNIGREMRSDDSGPWRIVDGDVASIGIVLAVLAEVARRTDGRIAFLTTTEARLVPLIYRAMEPRWTRLPTDAARAWQAYVWTRFYLSWARTEQDEQDATLLLASMQDQGQWPITRWFGIERVLNAAAGWLPDELREDGQ